MATIGFAPCWLEGAYNKGLGIFVATGQINGTTVNGQTVFVPKQSSTYVWVTNSGQIQTGAALPGGVYSIALVVSGTITTSGNQAASLLNTLGLFGGISTDDGIISITDLRV